MSDNHINDVPAQVRANFLLQYLETAQKELAVSAVGEPVFTGELRSVGLHSRDGSGDVWLRVAVDDPEARQLMRIDGNVEANSIKGVPKPEVFRWADWHGPYWQDGEIRVRGEVMTYVPDSPVSQDGDIYADPDLPDNWWLSLRQALLAVQRHPVPEKDFGWLPEYTAESVERFFDTKLPMELFTLEVEWVTAHGDLHWVNITYPRLWLLDWESWRRAPAWYDAASIYCNSLHHPPTANRIRHLFPELDTHSGTIAQLAVIGRYLWMTEEPEATPLYSLGLQLVERLRRL